jgi:hypothetical protein
MLHVIYHGRDPIGIYLSAHLPASWLSWIYEAGHEQRAAQLREYVELLASGSGREWHLENEMVERHNRVSWRGSDCSTKLGAKVLI